VTATVDFFGKDFRVAERVGLMPMMRFAVLAKTGIDANEMEALAAMHDLLKNCIDDDDWPRFEQHASEKRADGDDLMEVVGKVMVALADRPTGRSSDSSDGPRIIEPSSTDDSSSPVIHRLNDKGRPDLALMVRKREESLAG
jgi:hypothetical protein